MIYEREIAPWWIPLAVVLCGAVVGCLDNPTPKAASDTGTETVIGDTSTSAETEDADTSAETEATETSAETEDADTSAETEDADTSAETEDADTSAETEDASAETEDADTSAETEDTETSAETEDADVVTAPSPHALTVSQSATRMTIANDRFELVLDAESGWLPLELRSFEGSSQDLVYGDPSRITESWIGLSLYDRAHLWSLEDPPSLTEEGPAVVRLTRTFDISGELSGTSDLTVHPDGRLVLSWDLNVPTTRTPATLVAYATLDITRFTHVEAGSDLDWSLPTGQTPAGGFSFLTTSLGDVDYLCARNAISRDVVGFVERSVAGLNTLMPRITEHAGGGEAAHSIRLQYDFARDNVPAGTYAGRVLLTVDGSVTTCDRVALQAAAFRAPPTWTVTVGSLRLNVAGDADADGYVETAGFYTFTTTTRALSVQLDQGLPSATLRVYGPDWASPTVVKGGSTLAAGDDFIAQPARAGDGGWIVLLRPIATNDIVNVGW